MSEARNAAEQQFFDEHHKRQGTTSLSRFYTLSSARRRFDNLVLANCRGLRVLEYGCGPSGSAFPLADHGATVVGIDISNTAIELSRQRAANYPPGSLTFQLGDAEALQFEDGSFDLVCGTSILHHLDIERAAREIRRVLRPGGRAVFYEPVGHNPLVNLYRKLTPALHTADEHPLVVSDFRMLRSHFERVRTELYDFFSIAAIPLLRLPGGQVILRALELLDRPVLKIPLLRWWASVVVIDMRAGS